MCKQEQKIKYSMLNKVLHEQKQNERNGEDGREKKN